MSASDTKLTPLELLDRSLPSTFEPLRLAIERSKYMLNLEPNWDDNGSPGYERPTWERAMTLLLDTSLAYWKRHHATPAFPKIGKGPDGSIDLHWRTDSRELLINVPASSDDPATFYGDESTPTGTQLEGRMPVRDSEPWLLEWLMG